MKAPPIRLLEQHYNRISAEAVPEHRSEEDAGWLLKTTISLRQNPDHDRIWAILLEVTLEQEENRPSIPYEISAQTTGTFEIHADIPAEEIPKMLGINGVSILYSGLRDFVATITARGPWGVFLLPTVSFADIEPGGSPDGKDQSGESQSEPAPGQGK